MVGLAIRFELGRYHASPWGSHVNDAATEWPPSPWRLIRALYSVAHTNVALFDRQSTIDRALQTLIKSPPPVFELPAASPGHTRHYMPEVGYSALRPGDTAKILDGFVAIDPKAELFAWWDTALDAESADALAQTVRRLGYLGRSESVCCARMVTGVGPTQPSAVPASAVEEDDSRNWQLVDLLCPQRDAPLDALTVSVTELRKSRKLLPDATEQITYAVLPAGPRPASHVRTQNGPPTLALLRLRGGNRPSITEAVAIGQALRGAVQHMYGARNQKTASATFSGRSGDRPRDDQHRHAHYVCLPGQHSPRADKLVVWAPEGFGAAEIEALAGVTYLSLHGLPNPLPLALTALGTTGELRCPELLGPAHTWRSVTPFGLVRHPKQRGGELIDSPEDQVLRELLLRGFPEPEQISFQTGSWHRFRSSKAGQSRLDRASVVGVCLRFREKVSGPIAIGSFSHYGLGLFTPTD